MSGLAHVGFGSDTDTARRRHVLVGGGGTGTYTRELNEATSVLHFGSSLMMIVEREPLAKYTRTTINHTGRCAIVVRLIHRLDPSRGRTSRFGTASQHPNL